MAWFGKHKEIKDIRELINGALSKADNSLKGADELLSSHPMTDEHGLPGVSNAIAVGAKDIRLDALKELAKELRKIADQIENNEI